MPYIVSLSDDRNIMNGYDMNACKQFKKAISKEGCAFAVQDEVDRVSAEGLAYATAVLTLSHWPMCLEVSGLIRPWLA